MSVGLSWPCAVVYSSVSVFVDGRSRPVIMSDMKARIARGDIKAERREAIKVAFPTMYSCVALNLLIGHV